MNISLPDSLRSFVDERVRAGHYGTSSEYIRELIRRDHARLKLRDLLVAGLESPAVSKVDAKYWEGKRRRFLARK